MTDNKELDAAVDSINGERAPEVQENQVSTVNDLIVEHETEIMQREGQIEAWLDAIKMAKKEIRARKRSQEKLRQQREIYSRAAYELRQVLQP